MSNVDLNLLWGNPYTGGHSNFNCSFLIPRFVCPGVRQVLVLELVPRLPRRRGRGRERVPRQQLRGHGGQRNLDQRRLRGQASFRMRQSVAVVHHACNARWFERPLLVLKTSAAHNGRNPQNKVHNKNFVNHRFRNLGPPPPPKKKVQKSCFEI